MEAFKKFAIFLVKSIYLTILAIVTAFLPTGVLPKKSVRGEKVLITGGGSGIGRALAIRFAQLGAKVIIWDVNDKGAAETIEIIRNQAEAEAVSYHVDLCSASEISETSRKVREEVGDVDILVNNAGIAVAKLICLNTEEIVERTLTVNTKAIFYATQNFLPQMLAKNHGHIVTLASMAGKVASAGLSAYTASKHAAVGFHGSLTDELIALGKTGVRTTLVCPYYVRTPMFNAPDVAGSPLCPILEVDYVADRIVEAVQTDAELLITPKAGYFIVFLMSILPTSVSRLLRESAGISKHFEKSKEA
ncbi:unnamed protein product [Caenorhabditis angaria]|uniref:Short-chain dehydrogenase/reductase 3 n=1 Tax=Caenorhabditis angaria TaxID=860376 RepID=A0A9P1ISA1_9PELO|nr:unnamed protein product [Caenorhabditis angaria]